MRSPDSSLKAGLGLGRGAQRLGIHLALAIPGMKAEQAQDAQIILGDAGGGIADKAHPPGDQILHAAMIIENLAIGGGIKRIDGEIAPRRILAPVLGIGDHGMAAIGCHIAAQAGHFENLAVLDRGDGAMIECRWAPP